VPQRTRTSLGTVALRERPAELRRRAHFHVAILAAISGAGSAEEHLAVRDFVLHNPNADQKQVIHSSTSQYQQATASLVTGARARASKAKSQRFSTSSCWCDSRHLGSLHSFFKNLRHMATRRLSWMNLHASLFLQ
jgi:hypothetical protein